MNIRSNQIICIFGKREQGKSTLAKKIFKQVEYGIVFDPLKEHSDLGFVTKEITQANLQLHKKLVYQPVNAEKEAPAFFAACMCMFNFMLMVEEVDMIADSYVIEDNFLSIIRYGRHNGIGTMTINRRSKELNSKVLAQANHVFTFKQSRPEDIAYIEKFTEIPGEKIRNLNQYEYIHVEV